MSETHDNTVWSKRILWADESKVEDRASEAVAKDCYIVDMYEPVPIINNYAKICRRTYELPFKWYYLVFAPYNAPYAKDKEWYNTKGLDACRKKVTSCESFFLTKEIEASKVHINALCLSTKSLAELNGKGILGKYRIYAEECYSASRTFHYMTKEFRYRNPVLFKDYLYKLPTTENYKFNMILPANTI